MRLLAIPLLFLCIPIFAQPRIDGRTKGALQQLQDLARKYPHPQKLFEATQEFPTAMIAGRCMVGFLGKVNASFDTEAIDRDHIMIGARKGNIISFRIDIDHLDLIHGMHGLDYAELAGKVVPTLDKVVKATRADSVHAGIFLPQGYSGEGILIGITDWGFDYTHPMFHDTALTTTRIRAAWDQYRNAGNAPIGFGYGSEFTSPEELFAIASDTANIYSYHTHGTHVAGIAAGSGAGTNYRGIAFSSDLLFCTFLIDAAAVLDAFTWMQQIAEQDQERLVINMSWGLHHIGTLDGNSLLSQAIDQMSAEGVVFVSSGGNNGDVDFHIRKEFQSDTIRSRIDFYSYSANPNMWGQSISMWGEPGGSFSAGFSITNNSNSIVQESPWYSIATQQAYLDSFLLQGSDTVFFNLTADAAHPLNGRPHFRLRIKNTSSSLKIALKATATNGVVHFWNVTELTTGVGNWGMDFLASAPGWIAGDLYYGIGEPACTESLIAVAAYSSEYFSSTGVPLGGAIANFSSFGPTLDERVKPDLAAPGVNVASSISAFTDASFDPIVSIDHQGNTYPFARFSGTSMSAPAVTGIVALMLEADPTLTPAEVREILMQTARTDQHTGVIPPGGSSRWGMGKVNAYRAVAEALGVVAMPEAHDPGIIIWPNPVADEMHVLLPSIDFERIDVIDVSGRVVRSIPIVAMDRITISMIDRPAGAYFLRITGSGGVVMKKIIRQG